MYENEALAKTIRREQSLLLAQNGQSMAKSLTEHTGFIRVDILDCFISAGTSNAQETYVWS